MHDQETVYDAEQKIWACPRTGRKYSPNVTLGEESLKVLKKYPDKVFQISDSSGEERTGAELLRDSQLIAQYLTSQGLRPGDVVGICADNTSNLTAVVIASLLCGTPYNAAFHGFDKENLLLVFKVTTPEVFFCDVRNYETVKAAVNELGLSSKILTVNGKLEGVESVLDILKDEREILDNLRYPCADLNSDSTAAIYFTSGTTGNPKGCTISHAAFMELPLYPDVTSDSVVTAFSAINWVTGSMILYSSLLNGARRIITEKPFTPDYCFYLLDKYQITHYFVGTGHGGTLSECDKSLLGRYNLKSIKVVNTGGSKIHETVAKKLRSLFPKDTRFLNLYGLSEAGGTVSATTGDRLNYEGKLAPNIEARISDRISGKPLGPNEQGLLWLRTPFKWSGYYRDEESTKKAYVNGWISTGDLASFDNEGNLSLHGRESDVFKFNRFYINPNKFEDMILQLPGVAEVCVFPKPDIHFINLVSCAIVRTEDDAGRKLTENDVVDHVAQKVMDIYHIKGGVYFMDALPKNTNGKVLRKSIWGIVKDRSQG